MSRDEFYINHISDCIARIEKYTAAGKAAFFANEINQDAVIRNLQILGESTTRLSDELKSAHPEIDWDAYKAMRNVLVHGYISLSLKRVWGIVQKDIPKLKRVM